MTDGYLLGIWPLSSYEMTYDEQGALLGQTQQVGIRGVDVGAIPTPLYPTDQPLAVDPGLKHGGGGFGE